MANKRSLKRSINAICGELFSEGVAISVYYNCDKQNADTLLRTIMRMHSDYIMRISHTGAPVSVFPQRENLSCIRSMSLRLTTATG